MKYRWALMYKVYAIMILALSSLSTGIAQEYSWKGDAGSSDFFDENNWQSISGGQSPAAGEIDPAKPIDLILSFSGKATAQDLIQFGTGSLSISNGELTATDITGGSIEIGTNGYLDLSGSTSVLENTEINFSSPISWIKTMMVSPQTNHDKLLARITYKQQAAEYPENIRFDNYYTGGTVIRSNDASLEPLQIYSQASLMGTGSGVALNSVFSGDAIPGGLNNTIASFRLRRGYMATLAVEEDGTGKSKVFVASENDLVVNTLPGILSEGVSFVRVIPWNWVSKRGTGGDINGLENTWYYKWTNSDESDLQREYAPMAWGHSNADDDLDIQNFRSKYKATHVMAFNEPDDKNGQSGQYGNLYIPDTAINLYKNLMKTGMRLVSPGCREGAWDDWLQEFHQLAVEKDIRIDVIAVHWYDWGGNPANTPNADPENVFNRFKTYLSRVYELYGLPIWITEFNANTNRNTWVHQSFMELAIPYLESLEYIERYCWFQPVSGAANYYNENGFLTPVGEYYKSQATNPSIPYNAWASTNNLSIINGISKNNKESRKEITIYPNPVTDIIRIRYFNTIDRVDIFDSIGKKQTISISDNNLIDVSNLMPGLYFIRVNNTVKKFIKQ